MELNKQYPLQTNNDLLDFVEFALAYNVDYVYILEKIQDFLNGGRGYWTPSSYLDY
jgi:hypothetical protein